MIKVILGKTVTGDKEFLQVGAYCFVDDCFEILDNRQASATAEKKKRGRGRPRKNVKSDENGASSGAIPSAA